MSSAAKTRKKPKKAIEQKNKSLDDYIDVVDIFDQPLINEQRLYDLQSLIDDLGMSKEAIIERLKRVKWQSWTEALYSLHSNTEEENIKYLEFELILNKTAPAIYSEPCPRCKSTDTKMVGRQERAADEGGTARIICNKCNFIAIM